MRGLVIKEPWVDLILEGKKDWEIRSRKTLVRGKIYLIKSGSGLIVGEAELTNCLPLTKEQFSKTFIHHKVDNIDKFNYENIYAWVLKNPKKYEKPIPYKHPLGAIIWVNID